MNDQIYKFSGKNLTVEMAGALMNKDVRFIRSGLIAGILPIGCAVKKENSTRYEFYISPKLFYEYTGFYFDDDLLDESPRNKEKVEKNKF